MSFQDIFNAVLGLLSVVGAFLFGKVQDHEKRIQKIEDVQGLKIDALRQDFQDLESRIDKLSQSINDLATNIYKQKNNENMLNSTLTALLKFLETQQDKIK
jgi:outer membrane murein-binding lipoprotein Lpp